MTTVLISHNPFRTETKILIDEKPITDTSALFKYLHTPMQDWVGDFLPSLITDCNDDELEITFKGLPYNYEDLQSELDMFLQKNMDYDIELRFVACEDQITRLNKLNAALDEIKTQTIVEELKRPEFVTSLSPAANQLPVLLLGGSGSQQAALINGLFGTGLYNPKTDVQQIFLSIGHQLAPSASNHSLGPKSVEDFIQSTDKPIVICLLDDQLKRNKTGFLNTIADQYRLRGKQNKRRFLFVSETPGLAKRALHNEFAIKSALVYAFDEIALIQKQIEDYHRKVALVGHITTQCDHIAQQLNILEHDFSVRAEESKQTQTIDELETRALTLLDNFELVVSNPDTSNWVNSFIEHLYKDFLEIQFSDIRIYPLFTISSYSMHTAPFPLHTGMFAIPHLKQAIIAHIQGLPKKIENDLSLFETSTIQQVHINVPSAFYSVLAELELSSATTLVEELKKSLEAVSCTPLEKQKYLGKINALQLKQSQLFSLPPSTGFTTVEDYKAPFHKISSDIPGISNLEYQFFPGLIVLCCECFDVGTSLSQDKLRKCCRVFRKNISKISPILETFLVDLSAAHSVLESKRQQIFDKTIAELRRAIQDQARILRSAARISSDELEHLQYLQAMKERIINLTCLGDEESNG